MNDIYKEQLVKRIPSAKDNVLKALIVSGSAVVIVVVFVFFSASEALSVLAPVIAAALCFLAYYLIGNFNIEYEYIYTNGELDIDIIYSKSRRKRIMTVNVKDFEIMAHVEDIEHIHDFDKAEQVKDYSAGPVSQNTYAFLLNYKGKRTKFIIEPNDVLLKAFSTSMSKRKLFINPKTAGGF